MAKSPEAIAWRRSERDYDIASEAARLAAKEVRRFFEQQHSPLDEHSKSLIISEKYDLVFDETMAARARGELNDDRSIAPGLTLFMTEEARAFIIEQLCAKDGSPYADQIEAVADVSPEYPVFSLRLADGVYMVNDYGCAIYREATNEVDSSTALNSLGSLPLSDVVRVEGDSGELWQNITYSSDGTPVSQ